MRRFEVDDFEQNALKALRGGAVVALVGENDVLKRRIFAKAQKIFGLEPSDPFGVQRLSAQEISADPGRLADQAAAISMTGSMRLVLAACSSSQAISLLPVACEVIADKTIVFLCFEELTAEILPGESKTGKFLIVNCPAETARSMSAAIGETVEALGLRLEPAARETLLSLLADQREAIAFELDKLAIANARTPDHIFTSAEIFELIADSSTASAEAIAAYVLNGDINTLLQAMEQETSPAAHAAVLRYVSRLLSNAFRAHVNRWRSSGGALARLTEKDFLRLLRFANQATFQSRALSAEGDLLAQQALLQIARFVAARAER